MKLALKIFLGVVIVFMLIGIGGIVFLSQGLSSGAKLEIGKIDLTNVSDGKYTGSYDAGRWSNKVEVIVADKKITDIKVIKDVSFAKPELTKDLILRVKEKQNTDIDVVSGSTVTTKAYLKAIENAFVK